MNTKFLRSRCWLVLPALVLSGCASVMQGERQMVAVDVVCGGVQVPAQCVLDNSRGVWRLGAPGSVMVRRDGQPLRVACSSPFFGSTQLMVPASMHVTMAGNLLMGGVVGAGVDVLTGAGLGYPGHVQVTYPRCR